MVSGSGRARGKDLTDRFPDVQAALQAQLDIDCVLDGEIVVWTGEKLDFGQLQLRLVTSPAKARKLVAERPASFVVFDVLSVNGVDQRSQRWTTRHRRLELLAASWKPPLQVSPATADLDEVRECLEAFGHTGVEGLVVKGAASRYEPGKRSWIKINSLGVVVHGHVAGGPCAWSGGWCRMGCRARQVSRTCGGGVMVDLPVGPCRLGSGAIRCGWSGFARRCSQKTLRHCLIPPWTPDATLTRDARRGEISGSPQLSVSCRNTRRLGIAVVGR
jgi:hypothetical protein